MTTFTTGDNNFSGYTYIVNQTPGLGTHTTIAGAAAANASVAGSIFVCPGTYSESVTFTTSTNITAGGGNSSSRVFINGNTVFSATGFFCSNINFQVSSGVVFAATSAAGAVCNFDSCTFLSNGGDILDCSTGTGGFVFNNCTFTAASGARIFNVSVGSVSFFNCRDKTSTATTNLLSSGGNLNVYNSVFQSAFSLSNTTNLNLLNTSLIMPTNTIGITLASSSTALITDSYINSNNQSAMSIASGTTATLSGGICVKSSGTNAIAGAGTLVLAQCEFQGSFTNLIQNTITVTQGSNYIGNLTLGTPLPVASGGTGDSTLTGFVTGTGTAALTGTAITQFAAVTGGASNIPNFVAPGTSGRFFISQGASSQPIFGVPTVASVEGTSAAPTGTSSTAAYVMLGLGGSWKLTPTSFTTARITINGQLSNGTTGDGINVIMAFGTGVAPSNGAAVTGTAVGINTIFTDLTGLTTNGVPFSKQYIVTGLTPGTAYWFDLQFKAITGGTASVINAEFTAQELIS